MDQNGPFHQHLSGHSRNSNDIYSSSRSPTASSSTLTPQRLKFAHAIELIVESHEQDLKVFNDELSTWKAEILSLRTFLQQKDEEIEMLKTKLGTAEQNLSESQKETTELLEKYTKWRTYAWELEKFRRSIVQMVKGNGEAVTLAALKNKMPITDMPSMTATTTGGQNTQRDIHKQERIQAYSDKLENSASNNNNRRSRKPFDISFPDGQQHTSLHRDFSNTISNTDIMQEEIKDWMSQQDNDRTRNRDSPYMKADDRNTSTQISDKIDDNITSIDPECKNNNSSSSPSIMKSISQLDCYSSKPSDFQTIQNELASIFSLSHPRLKIHFKNLQQIASLKRYYNESWKSYQLALIEKCAVAELAAVEAEAAAAKQQVKERLLQGLLERKRKWTEEKDHDIAAFLQQNDSSESKSTRKMRSKRLATLSSSVSNKEHNGNLSDSGGAQGTTSKSTSANATKKLPTGSGSFSGPSIQHTLKDYEIEDDLDIFRQRKGQQGPTTRRTVKNLKANLYNTNSNPTKDAITQDKLIPEEF